MGSVRTAGYAIGEGRTSPRLEAIAGIRSDHVPGWLQARAGSPDPSGGYVQVSRRFHRSDRNKHPPFERQIWCAGQNLKVSLKDTHS